MIELKPCPFCGGNAGVENAIIISEYGMNAFVVRAM